MRVGNLVEDENRAVIILAFLQHLIEPGIVERFDFRDNALMRGIARHHARHVRAIGKDDGQVRWQVQCVDDFARTPNLANDAIGVVERSQYSMASIQAGKPPLGFPVRCPLFILR